MTGEYRGKRAPSGRGSFTGRIVAALALPAALLLTISLTGLPAEATPVNSDTPGFYAHTVIFDDGSGHQTSVAVGDGQLAPTQPLPSQGGDVFIGWFNDAADPPALFDIATTPITVDITLTAHFETTSHLVTFMTGTTSPSGNDVLKTVLVDDDLSLNQAGVVAVDLPDDQVPDGTFFTGQWLVAGATTAYNWDTPVTDDLTLYPQLNNGYYVWFESGGSPVAPQTVLAGYPVDQPADPTRDGYDFDGWYENKDCAGGYYPGSANDGSDPDGPVCDNSTAYDFLDSAVTGTVTLYGRWRAIEVPYKVVYWLEKPGIVPDDYPSVDYPSYQWTPADVTPVPAMCGGDAACGALSESQLKNTANYDSLSVVSMGGPGTGSWAGSSIAAPTADTSVPDPVMTALGAALDQDGVLAGVGIDPLRLADYAWADPPAVLAGDGSTVLNVYFRRTPLQFDFQLSSPQAGSTVTFNTVGDGQIFQGTNSGTGLLGTYSIMVKIGLDIEALGISPLPVNRQTGDWMILSRPSGSADGDPPTQVIRGWGNFVCVPTVVGASTIRNCYDSAASFVGTRLTASSKWGGTVENSSNQQALNMRAIYVESLDQTSSSATEPPGDWQQALTSQPTPDFSFTPPAKRLTVTAVYNSGRTDPIFTPAVGEDVFELNSLTWWTGILGGQKTHSTLVGFTPHDGCLSNGAGTCGNYSQWDYDNHLFYQLTDTQTLDGKADPGDLIIYTFYTRNSYALSFDTMGGDPIDTSCTIKYQAPVPAECQLEPTRAGANFLGWYADSEYTRPIDLTTITMPAAPMTVFAKWLVNPVTVQFFPSVDADEPLANLTVDDLPAGNTVSDPGPLPDNDGATFQGWYFCDGCNSDARRLLPYDWTQPVNQNLNLYARWKSSAQSASVTYLVGSGDTRGTAPTDGTQYSPDSLTRLLPGQGLTRGGAVFIGWTSSDDPSSALHYPGELAKVPAGGLVLTAQYGTLPQQVQATFVKNAGDTTPDVVWGNVVGAIAVWPDAADLKFTRDGYTFLGWSADQAATVPDAAYGRLNQAVLTQDVVLYAVWEALSAGATEPPPAVPTEVTTEAPPAIETGGQVVAGGTPGLVPVALLGGGLLLAIAIGRARRQTSGA